MKRTKIVCTIGPASQNEPTLRKMVEAGMNVVRMNFSHGSYDDHLRTMTLVRKVSRATDTPIALLQDLQGPKIRVGVMPKEGVQLVNGKTLIFSTAIRSYTDGKIPVQYPQFHKDVKKGERILMDDGLLEVEVVSKKGREVSCRVIVGGLLTSHKGINLPNTEVSISAITAKDRADVEFGIKNSVDFVALSFVRKAEDVKQLRSIITKLEKKFRKQGRTRIIVKIEKNEAIHNFSAILAEADGAMVARGDLGVEIPAQKVPVIQKWIINECLKAAKPVIVATQMLDSMIRNPRPTRAEVSDVANAVIDHTDAVMLSGETANGKYPVEAVKIMSEIIQETERSHYDDYTFKETREKLSRVDLAVSKIATSIAEKMFAKALLVATMYGKSARIVSRFRPELPIYAATCSDQVRRQLALSWGVIPFKLPIAGHIDTLVNSGIQYLKKHKKIEVDDTIVIMAGQPVGRAGKINWVKIHEVT